MERNMSPLYFWKKNLLIDLPVAKTHAFFLLSGALKNLFGLLPEAHKLIRYHTKGFADYEGRIFLDIYRNFPPDIVIIDGTISGEGYCPVAGRGKKTNFIITSDDAYSSDIVLSEIFGIHPHKVPYLRIAMREWGIPSFQLFTDINYGEFKVKRNRLKTPALFINLLWIIKENLFARLKKKGGKKWTNGS